MKALIPLVFLMVVLTGCQPTGPVAVNKSVSESSATASSGPTAEDLAAPKIPVPVGKRALKTVDMNLDGDPEEEQIILLQTKSNLSLPLALQVADFDVQRKTSYLAWEGESLASASQGFDLQIQSLIAPNQSEVVVRGQTESGRPSLDIYRLTTPSSGLGLQYARVFSQSSQGTIDLDSTAQGFSSVPVVVEEPDPASKNPLDTIKTIWEWRFQKSMYEVARVEHYRREKLADAVLEKLFAGDNAGLEAFLQGPWVKATTEKREEPVILFIDAVGREVVFASSSAQEVYLWEQTIRTLRNGVFISGRNDLIPLIKLQMSVAITTGDSLELSAQDNPNWSGTYLKLSESAARSLIGRNQQDSIPPKNPKGIFRNDKGDEFDFEFPEVRMTLGGHAWVASGALVTLGTVTVLQVKVVGADGRPQLLKAYSYALSEEATTSRVIRTIRLQEGKLTIKGWEAGAAEGLRLEQIELASTPNVNR